MIEPFYILQTCCVDDMLHLGEYKVIEVVELMYENTLEFDIEMSSPNSMSVIEFLEANNLFCRLTKNQKYIAVYEGKNVIFCMTVDLEHYYIISSEHHEFIKTLFSVINDNNI